MKRLKVGHIKHNYTHPHKPRYASFNANTEKRKFDGTIKVITYNIKLSKKIDKATTLLAQHDDLNDADIVCLQEMDPSGVKQIANAMNYHYVYYPAILHPRSEKDFGNAILSKWPIISDQKIILPKVGRGRLQRIAVYATISIDNFKVSVVCVHMKVFASRLQRRVPIDHILASIDPSIDHCIVAGDFNTFTKANCKAIFEPFHEARYQLVTDAVGSTYNYWYLLNKKASLDHIFIKGMTIINAGKVADRKPSDHIPIWGELNLKSDDQY